MPDGSVIDCTVQKYFRDVYNCELQYPHLPCLQVCQGVVYK